MHLKMVSQEKGFTLIELMVVVIIIAVLSAIALPSYQRYIVTNAEAEVRARMGQLQVELDRWRTTALSYRGFFPMKVGSAGRVTYEYDDGNTIIYVPAGSNHTNFVYRIELLDGSSQAGRAASLADNTSAIGAVGRSWVMRATPNPNRNVVKSGRTYVQRSTGLRCASKNPNNLPVEIQSCQNLETW